MKKNEIVIVGYKTEEVPVNVPETLDAEGNVIAEAYVLKRKVRVPITKTVTRDMTEAEVAELESQEAPEITPTADERIEAIEAAITELAQEVGSGG